ncbi:Nuclear receptor domain-containing protein [Aphelenchoides fujianensis]|nr:Nuclear receptor domain-containing protein [Aphelenchoides fujianensis]
MVVEKEDRCLVCEEPASHRHFSQRVCIACAAFFRRTIAKRRRYACKSGAGCQIAQRKHKSRCAYCRFSRCLSVGLKPEQVVENVDRFLDEGDRSLLSNCRLFYRGTFVSRRRNHVQMFGTESHWNSWDMKAVPEMWIRSMKIEGFTMREYLRNIGFVEFEEFGGEFEAQIGAELIFLWTCMEMAFNTRSHGGQRMQRCYYMDHSFMPVNEDVITDFYVQNPAVHSPRCLAINSLPFFRSLFETAELVHKTQVDDLERQAILLICLCNKLNRTISFSPRFTNWINEVLKNLHEHLKSTNADIATRFGQLLSIIEAIEEAHTVQLQFFRIVMLDYKSQSSFGYDCYSGHMFHPQKAIE